MSFDHLVQLAYLLQGMIAIDTPNQKLHNRVLKVLLSQIVFVEVDDMLICLHLTKLAHQHMECMLCIDIHPRQVIKCHLCSILLQLA